MSILRRFRLVSLLSPLLFVAACSPPAPSFKSMDITSVEWGGEFTLTAHTGKPVKGSDFNGKVVVMFFGYTHCPDICAPTLVKLDQIVKRLGGDANNVQVLFITVDPAHDTVKQLAGFVPSFNPSFIGLTGSDKEIAAVASEYKIAYGANPKAKPGQNLVDHSTGILVKDKKGKLRLLVKNSVAVEDLEHDIRVLLKERN
ncbi:MAG: SCO family protein [Gammaproteobacteria bacterium]|nr:SCO family protein [Gammaproteobacteria bacterium]MDH3407480.1 SCO family protein [Gammaproteobacteria bacterium]MDH3562684.1 SCO family protein [Gammaproteobacteria bacterium]MDH5487904.1 SCO family protein [Gammaproteobacteria bacterium]